MNADRLLPAVQRGYERYVEDLRRLVDIDCGSFTPAGVNRIAGYCEERLASSGWKVRRIPHVQAPGEAELGDCLVATLEGGLGPREGGRRFVFIGHMDTVFPEGTAARRPFRIDGDRAFGPGVCDMKDGLLSGFQALEVLRDQGWDRFAQLTFVCNPDEEIGSVFSGPIIREVAEGADYALVLESARASGAVVTSRKGTTGGPVEVLGRAAHAGVEPEKGRSAILAAAGLVRRLHDLNDSATGVTVNVGVIEGGTRPNVVPDRVRMEIDVRAPTQDAFDGVKAAVDRLLPEMPEGTRAAMRWYGEHRPMERTEATLAMYRTAREVAAELGIGELPEAATGGGSDANTTSSMGIPSLDGLGPVGGEPHSDDEWLDLSSVVPRTALLAGLIERLAG
ncbi:MAG: M20 family metallopeptidase [Actinobacteria bacterium]|nr:M20 family metallopeptidase [Actinomycetota bacterium]